MTQSDYLALIDRMSELNRSDPRAYRARVRRFVRLGYWAYSGHLILLLSCLCLMTVATVIVRGPALFLLVPILLATVVVVRSMSVRQPPTEGQRLSEEDAPGLYEDVRATALALKAKAPDAVYLDTTFNAGASASFRFATFGAEIRLHFGVELLLYLSPEEARSVLAHEIAHHCRRDVVFGAANDRLVQMWRNLMQPDQTGYSGAPMRPFLRWYLPRLEAMTVVLRRENEHEADLLAAQVTGNETTVRALTRIRAGSDLWLEPFQETYWPEAASRDSPPEDFLQRLAEWPLPTPEAFDRAVTRIAHKETGPYDSHPSTADRIARIEPGLDPRAESGRHDLVPLCTARSEGTALDAWLRPDVKVACLHAFDRKIAEEIGPTWPEKVRQWREDLARLSDSDVEHPDADAPESELWDKARAVRRIHGNGAALPWAMAAYRAGSQGCEQKLWLGGLYATVDDPRCIDLLEAASNDPDHEAAAWENLCRYYASTGDWEAEAQAYDRYRASMATENEIEAWLSDLKNDGHSVAADLPPEQRAALVAVLKEDPEVTAVYTVRRTHPVRNRQADLVVVAFSPAGFHVDRAKFVKPKLERLQGVVPLRESAVLWVVLKGSVQERAAAGIPGTCVYRTARP
ncbi:MAG: M48 family metalloprotease [Armatimonadetes bacterium]|nr:M48 family metalloprotease [Armatimonadota bacterium]